MVRTRAKSYTPQTARKSATKQKFRCKNGTRKNKSGVCDISKCQRELNHLKSMVNQLFPKIDKIQNKVNKLGE